MTDLQREMLDPAVKGTTGILKAIKAKAPSVKRVVITSSFAAIMDPTQKPNGYVYSEVGCPSVQLKDMPNAHNIDRKIGIL